MIALSLSSVDYIVEQDRELDTADQTTFVIKPLSAKDQAEVQDGLELGSENGSVKNFGVHSINILKKGLVNWRNFKNANGDQLKFNMSNKEANIDIIPTEIRYELAGKIMTLSTMGDNELKN